MRTPVEAADWEGDLAYRYGASLYIRSFFWEAHEVWEAVWKACPPNGVERRLLRGLIALANAALKLRMGRPKAALRLLREADEVLGEVGSGTVMGVAVAPLRAAARELAGVVDAGRVVGGPVGMSSAPASAPSPAESWEPAMIAGILRSLAPVALDSEENCTIMHQACKSAAL